LVVAKIRDTATVYLSGDVPKMRRGASSNASRNSPVERSRVDPRVLKYALSLVGGDFSRLKMVNETTIEILPEK